MQANFYENIKAIGRGIKANARLTIICIGVFLVALIFLCACKTTKTDIVDKSQINDSTAVKTEVRQDSTLKNQTIIKQEEKVEQQTGITNSKTENTEKEVTTENMTITFGEGGGTFNSITGEGTNVSSVKTNKETEKLKQEIQSLRNEITTVKTENTKLREENITLRGENKMLIDSIASINKQMDIQSKTEETYQMAWYWFLLFGAIGMTLIIVVLRKFPQTRWIFCWV